MFKNDRLNGSLYGIELGFVEREATPRLLIKLVFSSIWLDYRFQIQYLYLIYLVSTGSIYCS